LFAYGVKNFNSRALRSSVEQWYFDTSAKALGEAYRDFTIPVGITGTIEKMDYSQLALGDLAVTDDGVHVLAYVGDGKWIQAEPAVGKVVTLDGRKDANGWFSVPVTTHRWKLLTNPK
jgi:cell wall-associated NlpC family hydrolase